MKSTVLALTVILAMSLLVIVPADAAVRNIELQPVGDTGVAGTATTIVGQITGTMPYTNVELNVRMNTPPPANMIYQAWMIDSESNFLNPLGVFQGTQFNMRTQLAQFEGTTPYDTVAVSLEPARDTDPRPTTVVSQGSLPGTQVTAADFQRLAILPPTETFQRQVAMQRFGLTTDQVTELRMAGWGYTDINLAANIAVRCNRPVIEVAQMLQQGQSLEQLAQACNTTVAQLLQPVPQEMVAGFIGELPPTVTPTTPGTIQPMRFYLQFPNGRPVITEMTWREYQRRGFSWQDVAMAANVAVRTGENVDDLLRMVRVQGMTWRDIAVERRISTNDVMNVDMWPFARNGEETAMPPMQPGMTPGAVPPPATPTY